MYFLKLLFDSLIPGSFNKGLLCNIVINVNKTLLMVWQAVHCSPFQVLSIDKQTLPFLYKFGLKRVVPSLVNYVNLGGE